MYVDLVPLMSALVLQGLSEFRNWKAKAIPGELSADSAGESAL